MQAVHLSPTLTAQAVQHPDVGFVSFTGSVVGGKSIETAAVGTDGFKGVALEVCFLFWDLGCTCMRDLCVDCGPLVGE